MEKTKDQKRYEPEHQENIDHMEENIGEYKTKKVFKN
jgi:hypothetical protein